MIIFIINFHCISEHGYQIDNNNIVVNFYSSSMPSLLPPLATSRQRIQAQKPFNQKAFIHIQRNINKNVASYENGEGASYDTCFEC